MAALCAASRAASRRYESTKVYVLARIDAVNTLLGPAMDHRELPRQFLAIDLDDAAYVYGQGFSV
jgi:hypothetical protein